MHRLSGCSCQPSSLVEQAGGFEVKKVTGNIAEMVKSVLELRPRGLPC